MFTPGFDTEKSERSYTQRPRCCGTMQTDGKTLHSGKSPVTIRGWNQIEVLSGSRYSHSAPLMQLGTIALLDPPIEFAPADPG